MLVLLYVTEPNQNKTFAFAFVFKMWKIYIYLLRLGSTFEFQVIQDHYKLNNDLIVNQLSKYTT